MRIRKIAHGLANSTATLNQSLWVSGLISSHFVLILPHICLLLPRKCSFHVRAGSFVLSVSSRCYLLKLYLCSAVSGWHWWYVLLDSCLDPDKIHSSNDLCLLLSNPYGGLLASAKVVFIQTPPLKFLPQNPQCPL